MLARPSLLEAKSTVESDTAAIIEKHAKKGFIDFYCETFGGDPGLDYLAELIWKVSDDTCHFLQGMPPTLTVQRDIYLSQAEIDEVYAEHPGSRIPDSREWHYAMSSLKRRQHDKARGTPGLKPTLIAEISTGTVIDAILATIYIDKLRGRERRQCQLKGCVKEFDKTSDNGKKYCSQAHAHLASVRRKRAEERLKREKARNTPKPAKKKLRKAS